jgi:hypothetical protein
LAGHKDIPPENVLCPGGETEQVALRVAQCRLRDVQQFNDGRLATVRVAPREEDDVLVVFPFEQ